MAPNQLVGAAADAFHRPRDLTEALSLIAGGGRVLAGGTDFYPQLRDGAARGALVDLTGLVELRGVETSAAGWRIGAGVTWSELLAADLPPSFHGLKAAAREIGAAQIQSVATLAGNLCNASPAADGAPALMSLGAEVEIIGQASRRRMAVEDFLLGPGRAALEPGELVSAILIPPQPPDARAAFLKLGARRYLVISIVMVAAVLAPDAEGRVGAARIAVGACSPAALRLGSLERALIGAPMRGAEMAAMVAPEHLAALAPIDDVRASAAYRRDAALELTRRALARCAERRS